MSRRELDEVDDPRTLFRMATDAINRHRDDVDEMAAIRAASIAALYVEGYSYKELSQLLGISAPRVGQLVGSHDSAALEVLRAWAEVEQRLREVAQLVDRDRPAQDANFYNVAIDALARSSEFDRTALVDLDSIRHTRNLFVHGAADISVDTADQLLDKAVHLNALLTVWIYGERKRITEESSTAERTRRPGMPSIDQAMRKLSKIERDEADLRKRVSDASKAAAKARAIATAKRQQASKTSSSSMARSYTHAADVAGRRAATEDSKVADATKKLGELSKKRVAATKEVERANKAAERSKESAGAKRRTLEMRDAKELARQSGPTVHHVHETRTVEPPKPEKLRVLYLTANPDTDAYLRVDVEVREVMQAVRKATHRSQIKIDHRPAATPEDLLDGINESRPHVVHFAGHGDGSSVLFDHGTVDGLEGHAVSFDLLARALAATDIPPKVVILNACDTLRGADALLESVPVVIGMSSGISDLAASSFAARFYSTIASAQSVQASVDMGKVAVEMLDQNEGWKPAMKTRPGVDARSLLLIKVPELDSND